MISVATKGTYIKCGHEVGIYDFEARNETELENRIQNKMGYEK